MLGIFSVVPEVPFMRNDKLTGLLQVYSAGPDCVKGHKGNLWKKNNVDKTLSIESTGPSPLLAHNK